jgi:hypothetical protein
MLVSLRIEPSDFVVPTGPAVIFVKVDREALQYLNPSMNLLSDADSISTVLRKGKVAIEYARRQLSDILFGEDVAPVDIKSILPHPDFDVTPDSEPRLLAKYIGFYWKRHILAGGELSSALVELTSESVPVDDYLGFHAIEVVDEEDKASALGSTFRAEARSAAMRAEHAQSQAQAQAQTALQE